MVQLNPNQFTAKVRALFDPADPAALRAFAVLDGTIPGQVWVDDLAVPAWGIVREAGFGTLYLGGSPDPQQLNDLIFRLKGEGDVMIGLWDDDERLALLPAERDYDGRTLDIINRRRDVPLPAVPAGCELRQMDLALAERCQWRDFMATWYGSLEAFVNKGIGLSLMRGDEILSEAYAGPHGAGQIEIGIETPEAHRRQGYAAVVTAHLIHLCEQRGYETYWNAAKDNKASAALARKLGYQTEKEYRLVAWLKAPKND